MRGRKIASLEEGERAVLQLRKEGGGGGREGGVREGGVREGRAGGVMEGREGGVREGREGGVREEGGGGTEVRGEGEREQMIAPGPKQQEVISELIERGQRLQEAMVGSMLKSHHEGVLEAWSRGVDEPLTRYIHTHCTLVTVQSNLNYTVNWEFFDV